MADTPEPEANDPAPFSAAEDDALTAPDRDLWTDEDGKELGATPPYVRYAQIGLVVLAVLVIGIVVLVNSGKDDEDAKGTGGGGTDQEQVADDSTDGGSEGGTATEGDAKPAWPKAVEGRPAALGKRGEPATDVASTAKPGVYVWSDFDGWHLWIQGGFGIPERVTGTLTSNDELARADLVVPETGTVTVSGKTVTYDFDTTKGLTGMDFNTGFYGKRLVFLLNGPDGQPVEQSLIKTGSKTAAAVYPLVIEKA